MFATFVAKDSAQAAHSTLIDGSIAVSIAFYSSKIDGNRVSDAHNSSILADMECEYFSHQRTLFSTHHHQWQ